MRKESTIMKTQYKIVLSDHFDWQSIIGYLNREPNEIMYQVTNKGAVRRAFKCENIKYLIEITYHSHHLLVNVLSGIGPSTDIKDKIVPFIKEWFDTETDLDLFYTLAENDDILDTLVEEFSGLRLVGMPDFYEAITWGILGQQINLGYTYTLKRRFTEKFGEKLTYEQHDYWIYPDPDVVAKVTEEDLATLRLTKRKAEYLSDISKKIASKEISKEMYRKFDTAKSAEKAMINLRGIGPWTANYVLMRCLRMGDAFPMADIGLLNGIKTIKNLEAKPDEKYLLKLKNRWQSWSSYATFYIWRLLY